MAKKTNTAMSADDLESASREELYGVARERGLPGRSRMTRDDLVEALREEDDQASQKPGMPRSAAAVVASRFDAFASLAAARARGEMVMLPRMLTGNDRRRHVRETIREDHERRIVGGSEEAAAKFDKLAGSLFSFFRGTALLFYRDLAGEDALNPTVLALGDLHPENFGVMPSADNVPIFGVNDVDEASYAPFSWDLKRGAVGFMIAVGEKGGHGRKRQRKVARAFVEGYVQGISGFASSPSESDQQFRVDNSPPVVAGLIRNAVRDRSTWLASNYLDEYSRGFRNDKDLVPLTGRRDEFQAAIDTFVAGRGGALPDRAGEMRVKDVCERHGQGTASLGLARYYLLIEGPNQDGTDDLVLEMKQARRSALAGLVPPSDYMLDANADRVAHAHDVQLVRGDVFYGSIDFDGLSFILRERAPYRDSVDLGDLSKSDWQEYAETCGRTVAQAHALSDEAGRVDYDIEPAILDVMRPQELFVDDVLRFAAEAADRVATDHEYFRADHKLGAFGRVDVGYR